jgi:hypothetical protein
MGNQLEQTKQKPFCFRVFRVTKKGTREMKDACGIEEVILQENGIIRNEDGMIIGRLVEDINAFAEKHYQRGYEDGLRKAQEK